MKKGDFIKMTFPLTKENFLELKHALTYGQIERKDIPANILKSLDEMWAAENKKLKKEITEMNAPLSQKDFKKLKEALDFEEIERSDIPDEVLYNMDAMWATENNKRYNELLENGTFGAYD